MKKKAKKPEGFPKRVSEGNAEVTIYWQANPSRRLNPKTGKRELTGKVFDEYLLAYYQGTREVVDKKTGQPKQLPKLVREKFGHLKKSRSQGARGGQQTRQPPGRGAQAHQPRSPGLRWSHPGASRVHSDF